MLSAHVYSLFESSVDYQNLLSKIERTDHYVCIDRTVKEKQSRNQICWQITKECETTDSRLRLFLENPDGCSYILQSAIHHVHQQPHPKSIVHLFHKTIGTNPLVPAHYVVEANVQRIPHFAGFSAPVKVN